MQTVLINRIAEIKDNYDVFVFSFMGCIYDGQNVVPEAKVVMEKLRNEGKHILILANHSDRSYMTSLMLEHAGISSSLYDGILTSAEVVYHEMKQRQSQFFKNLGNCYYHIGREKNDNDWVDIGYIPVKSTDEAEFIIVSASENQQDAIERYLPFLRNAANFGLPMLCVNPDKSMSLPMSDDIGAGSIASRYEAMGGFVQMRGKPQQDLFMYCLEAFPGIDKSRFVMIANSYISDIKGAENVGIDSVLIGIGTHARELGLALGKPLSVQTVNELSRHYGSFPTYAITSIKY